MREDLPLLSLLVLSISDFNPKQSLSSLLPTAWEKQKQNKTEKSKSVLCKQPLQVACPFLTPRA